MFTNPMRREFLSLFNGDQDAGGTTKQDGQDGQDDQDGQNSQDDQTASAAK